jgi:hypothetical protein
MKTIKKGMWVQFNKTGHKYDGKRFKVMQGGKNPKFGFDFEYQNRNVAYRELQIKNFDQAHITYWGITETTPFEDTSSMKDFGITNYKYMDELSEETECFYANITYKGKKVMTIENSGSGEPNRIHALSKFRDIEELFYRSLKEWHKDLGITLFEDGMWFDYMTKGYIYGFTPQQYKANSGW